MFALSKLNEKPAPIVENNTTQEEVEDHEDLVTFADGYYSVYYQQCGITLPFPEASEFAYLDTNSAEHVESGMDNDKGWNLSDRAVDPTQTSFFKYFEREVTIGLTTLPGRTAPGNDYVPAHVGVMCYQDTTETIEESFERIEDSVNEFAASAIMLEGEPFGIDNKKVTTYGEVPAITFNIVGGFFGGMDYTLVRNESHVFVISTQTMSQDDNVTDTVDYISKNVSF
jgi:hypothetical protein